MPAEARATRLATMAGGALLALATAIVAAHAWLLPAGVWKGDEYFNFALFQQQGVHFLWQRLLTWSPRPVSEPVLFLYYQAVMASGRSLIPPFLAVMWLFALGSFCAGWRRPAEGIVALAVPATLFALCLLSAPVDEMFYWPMAAAPYLGALGCAGFVTLRLARGATFSATLPVALMLALGALQAELGMIFALLLAPLLALEAMVARRARGSWVWLLPAGASVVVVAMELTGRVARRMDPATEANPFYHHTWRSVRTAAHHLPGLLTGTPAAALAALALAGGAWCLASAAPQRPRAPHLLALIAALLGTIAVSLWAGFYQYGVDCCERHDSFRQCLLVLALFTAGALPAALVACPWPAARLRVAGYGLLILAAMALLPPRLRAIAQDAATLPGMVGARTRSWASARTAGPAMTLYLPPKGTVVGDNQLVLPGHYPDSPNPWDVWGILHFFGKTQLTVTH